MADSIHRIMPATLAPERVAVARHERDDHGRGGAQGRERQAASAVPAQPAQEGADPARAQDKSKGNRLDISA